jgi:hypothetical protein
MFRTAVVVALGASCAGLMLAGCSAHASVNSDPSIDKATLEQGISDTLTKKVGRKPDSVTCPGPLKAKAGQSERCVLVGDGTRYGLTATIASYENGHAHYDVQVDQQPMK